MTYPRQPSSTALAELSAGAKAALSSAAPKIRIGARRLFLYASSGLMAFGLLSASSAFDQAFVVLPAERLEQAKARFWELGSREMMIADKGLALNGYSYHDLPESPAGASIVAMTHEQLQTLERFGSERIDNSLLRERQRSDWDAQARDREQGRRLLAAQSLQDIKAAQRDPGALSPLSATAASLSVYKPLGWMAVLAPKASQLAKTDPQFNAWTQTSAAASWALAFGPGALIIVISFLISKRFTRHLRDLGTAALSANIGKANSDSQTLDRQPLSRLPIQALTSDTSLTAEEAKARRILKRRQL